MKCQTTNRGCPCLNEATYRISGGAINDHFTCERCKVNWESTPYYAGHLEPLMQISQNQIDRMIEQLAKVIPPWYDYIVGIAHSGLHVSRSLANKLNLPHKSIRISHYEGRVFRDKPIVEGFIPENSLVVDDLIDTQS